MIAHACWHRTLLICGLSVAAVLAGCGSPSARFDREAERIGAARVDASLPTFRRGTVINGQDIHIYLDGDGTPVAGSGRIALDPTSRERVILDLMAVDEAASVLIGRPCYHGERRDCDPSLWTVARYSDDVVSRLALAVTDLVMPYPDSKVVLIGYSGGGTLAMLIAPRLPRVDAVVTIAANLDTAAWTEHHGYGPLAGSRNPAAEAPLDVRVQQFHFFGAADVNAPVALARGALERQAAVAVEVIDGYTHRCCWPDIWASRLDEITRRLEADPGN